MRVDRRSFLGLVSGRVRVSAAADPAFDIQVLQTAASAENAVVAAYDTILGLPLLTGPTANPVLKNFLTTARNQHLDHATACNELATKLGGAAQTGANGAMAQVVTRARGGLNDLATAVDLALQLETASAHTYQNDVALLGDLNARRLAGSILAVESQHVALLLVFRPLLSARTPELVSFDPATPGRLPADAAKAGFPDSFVKPDQARPATEGGIR